MSGARGNLCPRRILALNPGKARNSLSVEPRPAVFLLLTYCRAARALGADSSVDFRKESYSETLQDFTAVVDTLGREKEGPQSLLNEAKGAAYFSLQPAILKVREDSTSYKSPPRSGLTIEHNTRWLIQEDRKKDTVENKRKMMVFDGAGNW